MTIYYESGEEGNTSRTYGMTAMTDLIEWLHLRETVDYEVIRERNPERYPSFIRMEGSAGTIIVVNGANNKIISATCGDEVCNHITAVGVHKGLFEIEHTSPDGRPEENIYWSFD